MALLYIVYHATLQHTHTIFESEQEAIDEIEKNITRESIAKVKVKAKGKGNAKAKGNVKAEAEDEDEDEDDNCGTDAGVAAAVAAAIGGAWSYRVVAMGTPFSPTIAAADPDTRAFVDQQFVRAEFVQCEPRHPCHLELIAHVVGSSASDVADRLQPYRRSMAVHRLTRRAENAVLDDLHICAFLYSITIYLCVAAGTSAMYSIARTPTSAQTNRSVVILREGCKFSLLQRQKTTANENKHGKMK
jgi:hypothetical protein